MTIEILLNPLAYNVRLSILWLKERYERELTGSEIKEVVAFPEGCPEKEVEVNSSKNSVTCLLLAEKNPGKVILRFKFCDANFNCKTPFLAVDIDKYKKMLTESKTLKKPDEPKNPI